METELKMEESWKKHFPCVILIGMPGAGKTTVGQVLANRLNWAFLDTDKIIESLYGTRLQAITDHFGKEEFLKIEGKIICTLDASRCVIATGGSVVYDRSAMEKLKSLGPVVFLDVPLSVLLKRIEKEPERGIAMAPGQTLEDLFNEREKLYKKYADTVIYTDDLSADKLAEEILNRLSLSNLNADTFSQESGL